MSRFQFVADHTTPTTSSARPGWSVKRLCALLDLHRSSFYAWKAAAPARAARTAADADLAARIRTVHAQDTTCGRPRITAELNDGAPPERRVNHKRVARVMREHGIRGYHRRRRVRTTIPEQANATVPDLLGRDFTAPAPRRSYVVSRGGVGWGFELAVELAGDVSAEAAADLAVGLALGSAVLGVGAGGGVQA